MLKHVELPSGNTLNVYDAGSGPAMLLVHGFPLDHSMWVGQLSDLPGESRLIAPDLRGFGGSHAGAPVSSLADFASDLVELLNVLQVDEPIVYCGLSMGGYIGFRFVEQAAERLKGLILCDTRAGADSSEAVENRHRMVDIVRQKGAAPIAEAMQSKLFGSKTLEQHTAIVEATRAVMLATEPETIAAALLAMANRPDSTPQLETLPVPSLWVCGTEDAITTVNEMQDNAGRAPRSRFVEIPGAGHMAPLEQPAIVNAAIRSFLSEL